MRSYLLAASALALTFPVAVYAAAPAPASAQSANAASVPAGKLTDAARPLAYRLDLSVDPAQDRFSGKVEIDTELRQPSSTIDLHGRDLAMRSVVARVGGEAVPGTWAELDPTGVGRLTFAKVLPAGKVTLAFAYDAPFNSGPAGMFRVHVGDAWYSWTQFESIDARAAFPGFDEPRFKVPFTVTLRTPPGLTAISNAPQESVTREGGMDVHRFAPTLPLPTYLVAMMVGPFAAVEGAVPPTAQRAAPLPLRVVSPAPNAGKLDYAFKGSQEIVALLEDYFGQSFPYPKLDQITSPIMPGAMENAGADLYNDSILVMDEKAPITRQRRLGMVVAHELAHQWFGDLVTPAWWDDIWLNESFANWMGYRIGDAWKPELNIRSGALNEGFAAMDTDALLAGRAIRHSITTNAQIDEAFDSITYGKGGHVVAMIAGYMGDTKFRDGVRSYMAAHRYGNATSTDFFAAMAKVAGDPAIVPAMRSFIDQQGVPLLTFTDQGKGHWTVAQSRYALLGESAPATRWGVPLCVRVAAERQCQLLSGDTGHLQFAARGPIVPNAGGTGYYRFELPAREWDRLIAAADRLPGGEALAVADSLEASFRAGRATPAQLVALAKRLSRHGDSYANAAGYSLLESLGKGQLLDDAATAGQARLIAKLDRPRLAKLGLDLRAGVYAGEDPERSQARVQIVARLANTVMDAGVRRKLAGAAAAYLAGDTAALDPAWFATALAVWRFNAGLDGAKRLAEAALSSQDPQFRPAAINTLGATGSTEVAAWLLDEFKDNRLRSSERISLITDILASSGTADFGFKWLGQHYAELDGAGGIFLSSRLPRAFAGACSAERADAVEALLRPRLAGKTGALSLDRTLERIRTCAALKAARADETSKALKRG